MSKTTIADRWATDPPPQIIKKSPVRYLAEPLYLGEAKSSDDQTVAYVYAVGTNKHDVLISTELTLDSKPDINPSIEYVTLVTYLTKNNLDLHEPKP